MPSRLVRSRRLTVLAIAAVALTGAVSRAVAAQVRVNPTGVNVNTQGSTTVFLTYGGLAGYDKERGIELWLEGRRIGDLRRWAAVNAPGSLNALEIPGAASYLTGQDTCFPVSREEINTNPNLTP